MINAWFGAVTSLVGVGLGTGAAYITQERHWLRQSRLQTYSQFIGECRLWFDCLLRISYTLRHAWPIESRRPYWDSSNAAREQANSLRLQVELLANTRTTVAARKLMHELAGLNDTIHNHQKATTEPTVDDTYRQQIEPLLDEFVEAAGRELGARRSNRLRTQ